MITGEVTRICNRPDLAKYAVPRLAKREPRYNWFLFPHSFAPQLVDAILKRFSAASDSLVLDCCLGAGTTLLACRQKGISAIGFDQLPLAVDVSNAKIQDYELGRVKENYRFVENLMREKHPSNKPEVPDFPVLQTAYDAEVLSELLRLRDAINRVDNRKNRLFLTTAYVAIVCQFSDRSKSGGWLRIDREPSRNPQSVMHTFSNQVRSMIHDLETSPLCPHNGGRWEAIQHDCREIHPSVKCDIVITSPPYLNRHDYTRIFELELALSSILTYQELKELRHSSIRSHVEANNKRITLSQLDGYKPPDYLTEVINELSSRPLNNNRIVTTISGYFEDLYMLLKSIYNMLEERGKIALILGDVRYAGVAIPVHDIVIELGACLGLEWDNTWVIRYRGNSPQQMKHFGRLPSAESIIFLHKN